MSGKAATVGEGQITLRRSLSFWDLLLYGIVLIQPTAPMPSFGVIYQVARGHVVTAILVRDGRHAFHVGQLWAHGARLPSRWFSLHLCRQGTPSQSRLYDRMVPGNGLRSESADLHHLVQQGRAEHRSGNSVCCVRNFLCSIFYAAEPERRRNFSAHQRRHGGRTRYCCHSGCRLQWCAT